MTRGKKTTETTEQEVSPTEFRRNFAHFFNLVAYGGKTVVITRHGQKVRLSRDRYGAVNGQNPA